jgi:hypothetical protein
VDDEFFTIAEVAAKFKVSGSTVRKWIQTGALNARLLPSNRNKRYRVPWTSLEEFGTQPVVVVEPKPEEPAKPVRRRRKYRPSILRD